MFRNRLIIMIAMFLCGLTLVFSAPVRTYAETSAAEEETLEDPLYGEDDDYEAVDNGTDLDEELSPGVEGLMKWITGLAALLGVLAIWRFIVSMMEDRPESKLQAATLAGIAITLSLIRIVLTVIGIWNP